MDGEYVDALVATASDGIAFDDLHVAHESDGYTFQTPDVDHSGIDEATLRTVATDSPYVRNWYFWHATAPQKADRWAFLRWLEGAEQRDVAERYDALADGIAATWGELHLTVTLSDGERTYGVRHRADADAGTSALDTHDDPLDAREIAKHDDDGGYRPLKTAPSLRTGWVFPELSPSDLVTTAETFYPATIANWHREQEGELDVTHWRDTVDRQTGIYGVVKTWDRGDGYEHVNWVAEACCDDSQCLKRREWQYDDETELDVDGGSGQFPCREPCSLVIAGARKWTKLEGEQSQTYEFELTPSEKEQIEDIIDAVADGEADDIREADIYEGANQYRARFLRAKLFDDEGNLGGVETEQ
jgi:sirohydrochlorin ferrochelatase